MMNYARQFVSCEDDMLPIPHHKLGGVYNPAATLTSIAIMYVPLAFIHRAFFPKQQEEMVLEMKLYAMSQFLLFFGNLYQHWTGYMGPPCLDTCSCVYALMLLSLLNRVDAAAAKERKEDEESSVLRSPKQFTNLMITIALVLVSIGFHDTEMETFATMSVVPIVGFSALYRLGRLCHARRLDLLVFGNNNPSTAVAAATASPWTLYLTLVLLIFVVLGSAEAERFLCPYMSELGKRMYHSIYLHIIVPAHFWVMNELVFFHTLINYGVSHNKSTSRMEKAQRADQKSE